MHVIFPYALHQNIYGEVIAVRKSVVVLGIVLILGIAAMPAASAVTQTQRFVSILRATGFETELPEGGRWIASYPYKDICAIARIEFPNTTELNAVSLVFSIEDPDLDPEIASRALLLPILAILSLFPEELYEDVARAMMYDIPDLQDAKPGTPRVQVGDLVIEGGYAFSDHRLVFAWTLIRIEH